ncbi:MAG TPA: DUF3467 domain-containing protein [Bryobacteraceae bacterium]|nr:DUF3467 domain-containing protein [Bryobacteraceae bacterium]
MLSLKAFLAQTFPRTGKAPPAAKVENAPAAQSGEARYFNSFQIGHNAFEFVFEFGQAYPDTENPQIHTRLVTGPAHARELFELLGQAVEEYETEFGPAGDNK